MGLGERGQQCTRAGKYSMLSSRYAFQVLHGTVSYLIVNGMYLLQI